MGRCIHLSLLILSPHHWLWAFFNHFVSFQFQSFIRPSLSLRWGFLTFKFPVNISCSLVRNHHLLLFLLLVFLLLLLLRARECVLLLTLAHWLREDAGNRTVGMFWKKQVWHQENTKLRELEGLSKLYSVHRKLGELASIQLLTPQVWVDSSPACSRETHSDIGKPVRDVRGSRWLYCWDLLSPSPLCLLHSPLFVMPPTICSRQFNSGAVGSIGGHITWPSADEHQETVMI